MKSYLPSWKNSLNVTMITGAVVIYFMVLYSLCLNIPMQDDFSVILQSLINLVQHVSFDDKIRFLFAQHNEHRPAFVRLVALGDWYVFGSLDFRHLIFLGNLALIAFFVVICRSHFFDSTKKKACIPAAFLLFQYQYFNNSLWATGSLQAFWVQFFAIAAAVTAFKTSLRSNVFAILLCLGAVSCQGNGLLVPFSITAVYLLRRKKQHVILWTTISFLITGLYFIDYTFLGDRILSNFSLFILLKKPRAFFWFIGSAFVPGKIKTSIICGCFIFLYIFLLLWKKNKTINEPFLCYIFFALGSIFLASITRESVLLNCNVDQRYVISSVLLIIVVYLQTNERDILAKEYILFRCLSSKHHTVHAIIAIILCFYSYGYKIQELNFKTACMKQAAHFVQENEGYRYYYGVMCYGDPAESAQIIEESKEFGIFKLPRVDS